MSLTVTADGALTLRGKSFRGIGVNYVDCFWRLLENPDDASLRAGFAALAAAKIPFVRFAACGYWPADNALYRSDRADYLHRLDTVIAAAQAQKIGLIPSLFWHYATLPDLAGEPASALGDTRSRTHALLREYTETIVRRYRSSPAIWGWELGNEYNLPADLPNAAEHRPPLVPDRGTPTTRSAADELTHDQVRTAVRAFAREVRRHDPKRLLSAGHGFPRASAWHQKAERSWTADSEAQFAQMLAGDSPDPIDTLGGHLYAEEGQRFGAPFSQDRLIKVAMDAARAAKKPLFVGEFGTPGEGGRDAFAKMLAALVTHAVPLAALWVFDFAAQRSEWSVTPDGPRGWQLRAIAEANERLRHKG